MVLMILTILPRSRRVRLQFEDKPASRSAPEGFPLSFHQLLFQTQVLQRPGIHLMPNVDDESPIGLLAATIEHASLVGVFPLHRVVADQG